MELFNYLDLYRKGLVKTTGKIENLELLPFEEKFFNHIHDNRFSIIKKSRQMHVTNMLASYSAWLISEKPYIGPEDKEESTPTVIYLSNNFESSKRFKTLVMNILPEDTNTAVNNVREVRLNKGNSLKVMSATMGSLHSQSFTYTKLVIIDEMAFLKRNGEFLTALLPLLTESKTKLIIASTPNGLETFHTLWNGATTDKNQFAPLNLTYKDNPLYTEEWLEQMKKNLNYNEAQIRQELYGEFTLAPTKDELKKKSKKKSNLIQVRLDDDTLNQIGRKLIEKDINMSEYIRELIKSDLTN